MKVYADASFLVSLYYPDAHSLEAERRIRRSPSSLFLTILAKLELVNALQLRIFRREASRSEIAAAKNELEKDIHDGLFSVVSVSAETYELAQGISMRRSASLGTRTPDILHVACALSLNVESFWTFDTRQAQLARAEGLKLR